ncbi:MAG TPA: valine--tRNA ligase [Alphaproteobacteria bacterium]|nr:valine--tRNA ligase [Alphaproteobacteria bacterium]
MLEKTYRPREVEARLYELWERSGAFHADLASSRRPYVIMMPPPNVTGSLHMGHALTFTLQDILIRLHRMRGRDVLWQPGTDHAGIATQMVVERQLEARQETRLRLGREKFLERVWEWRAQSGGTILRQLRRLGASADWARERFTMDEGLSLAVRKVFVDLYKQGLIYRDKRLVNWDPKLHTAISDLEVQAREVKGKLWHFRYPLEGEEARFITVATTRPETMLGDTAVAVHPEDARYAALVGRHAILPLVGRRIPIIADLHADPTQGSGAVKITPAHDFNDFEVGKRHRLPMINIFDRDARLNENAPAAYRGLAREEARAKVVAAMEALGLLEKVEDHVLMLPYGDRTGEVIEPWLTDQWFVDAKTLAQPAIDAVKSGRTRIVPKQWEGVYFDWMTNIQPWCVSRQIWWGHQIPAWYAPDGRIFVEMTEAEAKAAAARHYGHEVPLKRDEDVLDTWFSSALWPFSTLGWPEKTPELARYYPGDVLVTGFDILFFWVARMMMMGLHFMDGEVPFRDVYIHALVRDQYGQKMSKSKGNVLDPVDLIDSYGCDALRFTLAALAAQGRDIKLSEGRIEGYRNFCTKLWNAARFCQMNGCAPEPSFAPEHCRQTINLWIVGELAELGRKVATALESYRFNDAAALLYRFTWNSFCDWYIELAKPILTGADATAKQETQAAAAWVLDQLLHYLHPLMPFITEELYGALGERGGARLITAAWPSLGDETINQAARDEINWLVRVIGELRSVRAEMNVPPAARIPVEVRGANPTTRRRLDTHRELIARLARLSRIEAGVEAPIPRGAVQVVVDEATLVLPLADVIDIARERARLEKEMAKLAGEVEKIERKLANRDFVAKAPEEVVEEQRERSQEAAAARDKLSEALSRLVGA